jgi:hypothetical protein
VRGAHPGADHDPVSLPSETAKSRSQCRRLPSRRARVSARPPHPGPAPPGHRIQSINRPACRQRQRNLLQPLGKYERGHPGTAHHHQQQCRQDGDAAGCGRAASDGGQHQAKCRIQHAQRHGEHRKADEAAADANFENRDRSCVDQRELKQADQRGRDDSGQEILRLAERRRAKALPDAPLSRQEQNECA